MQGSLVVCLTADDVPSCLPCPCCRFTVPADLLEPSVITAYLAVCNEHGSVVRVVDSGKLLILAANEAAEVQRLFKQTTKQVQQLVCSSACSPADAQQSSNAEAKSHAGLQGALSGLFTRFGARKHNPERGSGNSSSGNTVEPGPSTARQAQVPDAATLYSFEHFFVPMLRQWSIVFAHSDGEVLTLSSAIVPEVLPSGAAAQSQIMQLLNLLVEHEMWACALLLLGRHPALADQVQRAGLRQEDDEGASPMLLAQMRRGVQVAAPALLHQQQQLQQQPLTLCQQQMLLQPQQRQPLLGYQQQQQQTGQSMLQQQQLVLQMQRDPALLHQQQMALLQQHMLVLQQMQQQQQQLGLIPPNMLGNMVNVPPVANVPQALPGQRRGVSPSGSDETFESASEILMRLGLLQQARGEQGQLEPEALAQGALADYMQDCGDEGHGSAQQQQQQQPPDFLWASSAWSVPLPYGPPVPQRATAAKTAPMNLVPVVSGAAAGNRACDAPHPSQAALAAAVAKAAWGPGVEGFTALNAMYALPDYTGSMSLDCSTQTPVTEKMAPLAAPAATAAAMPVVAACGSASAAADSGASAEAVGLRQRRGPTGSLFGRQRKLSWEEEQPEPVPKAPFLPVLQAGAQGQPGMPAAAAGWYPGAWQLPEPSNGLLYGAGGGFAAPRYAQPPQPEGAANVSPEGRLCGYDDYAGNMVTDPYTAPVFDSEVNSGEQQQGGLGEGEGQQQQQQEEQAVQPSQATFQRQQQQEEKEKCDTGIASPVVAKGLSDTKHVQEADAQQACCSSNSSCTAGSVDMDASCKASSCKPGAVSDSSGSNALLRAPLAGLSWQRPWELLRQCAWGFEDPCLESSYLVFKNHGCSLLDATAGLICTSMLLTSTLRSLKSGSGCSVWLQLMTMLLYAAFFFLPYIIMKLRLQVFLRLREQLLVFGRNTGAIVLAVMALGYLPMVEVWRKVIVHSLSLQIQNGFILPACQQVRLPAALMIAAVHIPADAIWMAAGRPFKAALLHSVLMQVSSVSVALLFDAWCRMRFVQRYSGMTAGRQHAAAPHQQS